MKKLTTEEFIQKAREIHGDKYDYSLVEYVKAHSVVKIICPVHGIFEQEAKSHYEGHNCPYCAKRKRLTTEEFIHKAREIHKNKYDYSLVNFINNKEKVKIICPVHGMFEQVAKSHLSGYGCASCSYKKKELTTLSFVEKSKVIHGNLYNYSRSEYFGRKGKVLIYCNKHGYFLQSPFNHLQGCGCPICRQSQGELEILTILEELNINFETQKMFDDCKNINKLRFDFFLPDYNTVIEFNGIQHYEPIEYFGGEEVFEESQKRDTIKKEYCFNNGIKFIEIRFDQQNIKDMLIKEIIA